MTPFDSMDHRSGPFDPQIRGRVDVHFSTPQVPQGMGYDPETLLVLPADARYEVTWVRIIASAGLGLLLFAATLGVGYLAWSLATWARGQTPAQGLLGLRCWDPETRQVPGRWQMAQRQFLNLVGSTWTTILLLFSILTLFSVFTRRGLTSVGDFILGTIVVHDQEGTLLSLRETR